MPAWLNKEGLTHLWGRCKERLEALSAEVATKATVRNYEVEISEYHPYTYEWTKDGGAAIEYNGHIVFSDDGSHFLTARYNNSNDTIYYYVYAISEGLIINISNGEFPVMYTLSIYSSPSISSMIITNNGESFAILLSSPFFSNVNSNVIIFRKSNGATNEAYDVFEFDPSEFEEDHTSVIGARFIDDDPNLPVLMTSNTDGYNYTIPCTFDQGAGVYTVWFNHKCLVGMGVGEITTCVSRAMDNDSGRVVCAYGGYLHILTKNKPSNDEPLNYISLVESIYVDDLFNDIAASSDLQHIVIRTGYESMSYYRFENETLTEIQTINAPARVANIAMVEDGSKIYVRIVDYPYILKYTLTDGEYLQVLDGQPMPDLLYEIKAVGSKLYGLSPNEKTMNIYTNHDTPDYWVGNTQTIPVEGMTPDMRPICDVVLSDDKATSEEQEENWNRITTVKSGEGCVTVTCRDDLPEIPLIMQMKVVE